MNDERATEILKALLHGVDPLTGEQLACYTVLQHPEVLRAIFAGITALQYTQSRTQRRRALPQKNGLPWSHEDLEELRRAFLNGAQVAELAAQHGRTVRAVEIRLEKLGLFRSTPKHADQSSRGAGHGKPDAMIQVSPAV